MARMVQALNYVAWGIGLALLAWLVIDALRVEVTFDHELLVSSVEGEIEKEILGHEDATEHGRA
jgi:hypothetical protein